MKKITFLSLFLIFLISSSVQASGWAYDFIVWDGKVYEVKKEEMIEKSDLGKRIGRVTTQRTEPLIIDGIYTSGMTYYGNYSNAYRVGTPYREIKGISTSSSIAVKVDNGWIKADYVTNAPYHVMNTIIDLLIIVPLVIIPLILIGFFYRGKKINGYVKIQEYFDNKKW